MEASSIFLIIYGVLASLKHVFNLTIHPYDPFPVTDQILSVKIAFGLTFAFILWFIFLGTGSVVYPLSPGSPVIPTEGRSLVKGIIPNECRIWYLCPFREIGTCRNFCPILGFSSGGVQ